MKLSGENVIPASQAKVWQALNDPEILKQCIPGCESLEKISDTAFKATVATKIGPVQARFTGQVNLTDLDPPNGYTISGSGSGGVAGNAKGGAKVHLTPEGVNTTKLVYNVDAQVTGKLAQLGSRLIDSTAKMLAGQFFNKFQAVVGGPPPAPEPEPAVDTTAHSHATAHAHAAAAPNSNAIIWIAALFWIAVVVVAFYLAARPQ